MAKKLGWLHEAAKSETLTLTKADGSTFTVPIRSREVEEGRENEKRRRTVTWPDFTALSDERGEYVRCDTCEGHPAIGAGDMNHGAPRGGIFSADVLAVGHKPEGPRFDTSAAFACDCEYGAWIHKCMDLPFYAEYGDLVDHHTLQLRPRVRYQRPAAQSPAWFQD
jgi:hypothetical protein